MSVIFKPLNCYLRAPTVHPHCPTIVSSQPSQLSTGLPQRGTATTAIDDLCMTFDFNWCRPGCSELGH